MARLGDDGSIRHRPEVPEDSTLRPLAQKVVRNAIIDGEFPAGQKLIERELCELTGASRSVLREALANLEATGLVERQSYCGFRVAELTARKAIEIFELRSCLETLAAELFAARASDEEIAALGRAFAVIERCAEKFDLKEMRDAKERYYDILFSGCRNEEIGQALNNVIDRISFLRSRLLLNEERRAASIEDFRRLTDALVERNPVAVRAASLAHLEAAREAVLKVLAEERSPAKPRRAIPRSMRSSA